MLAFLFAVLSLVQVNDASTGSPLSVPGTVSSEAGESSRVTILADGSRIGYASFHGSFSSGAGPRTIRLLRLSRNERAEIERINAFRKTYGAPPLAVDENLMETARYWAREEQTAGRIGHTCAALGAPRDCVEFNAYFHALPGAPADWFSGQNAAFDTISDWLSPESGFENERLTRSGERGHFLNLIGATRWIGFGKSSVPGYGSYFAMNLL